MGLFDELKDPNSNFVFNLIVLSLSALVVLLIIIYVISTWGQSDKIYQMVTNLISILLGLIGGRSLGGKNQNKRGHQNAIN